MAGAAAFLAVVLVTLGPVQGEDGDGDDDVQADSPAVVVDATETNPEPGPRPEISPAMVALDSTADRAEPPEVDTWLPTAGHHCRRRNGRVVCDGPRRAPAPEGEAAALAERLGFGDRQTAHRLLTRGPLPSWVDAVMGEAPTDLHWPVDSGRMWRGFGMVRQRARVRHRPHMGVDIGAAEGSPIRAAADGLVVYADNGVRGYGNLMMIVHKDASVAYYAHCRALYFFPGQQVTRGEIIAEVGHTGLARGPHLHFELRIEGRPRNPSDRFVERPAPRRGQNRR